MEKLPTIVGDPVELRSTGGTLSLDLTMLNTVDASGNPEYCYALTNTAEAPLLRLNPGDKLNIKLKNRLTSLESSMPAMQHGSFASGPCAASSMSSLSTNIHFHGLNIPPKCHQDEVIKTAIQPSDVPFQYNIQIPKNDPPGLYWYHPHPHGFTTTQITGGAAGPLIIDGIEQMAPETAGLPERVFVIRQVNLHPPLPSRTKPPDNDTAALSINFVPAFEKLARLPRSR